MPAGAEGWKADMDFALEQGLARAKTKILLKSPLILPMEIQRWKNSLVTKDFC